jgi:hypothetical protein
MTQPFDFEIFIKIIPLLFAAIGTMKLIKDWLLSNHGKLREEYAFARDFLKEAKNDPNLHEFLKQKGYQAIAGNARISVDEVEHLLLMQDPAYSLRDYAFSSSYLKYFSTAAKEKITFRTKYQSPSYRNWLKKWYFILYICLVLGAFLPLLIPIFKLATILPLFLVAFLTCIPLAFLALLENLRIARAEELVKRQSP